jgi:hypothetical protein
MTGALIGGGSGADGVGGGGTGGVQISPDVLRQAGAALGQVCGQLDGELNKLKSELLSMGQPWGDDDIGQLIGVAYQEVVSWAFDCLKDVLDDLCRSGTDLTDQADHWVNQEQSIEGHLGSFLGAIGSA